MDPQSCMKCGLMPQDILVLSCKHDLCLKCAGERVGRDNRRKFGASGIVCEFCGSKTQLDANTLYELDKALVDRSEKVINKSLNSSLKKDPKENSYVGYARRLDTYQHSPLQPRKSLSNLHNVPARSSQIPKEGSECSFVSKRLNTQATQTKNRRAFCQTHPDQQILYYCFDCNCQCICPECVIHGQHKSHQVQTIKKSFPIVKSQLTNMQQTINKNIEEMSSQQLKLVKQMDDMTVNNENLKKQIQKSFSDLVDLVRRKQQQTLMKCDTILNTIIDGFKTSHEIIQEKMHERRDFISQIMTAFTKDQKGVLNFYAQAHKSIQGLSIRVNIQELVNTESRGLPSRSSLDKEFKEIRDIMSKLDIDSAVSCEPKFQYSGPRSLRQSQVTQKYPIMSRREEFSAREMLKVPSRHAI